MVILCYIGNSERALSQRKPTKWEKEGRQESTVWGTDWPAQNAPWLQELFRGHHAGKVHVRVPLSAVHAVLDLLGTHRAWHLGPPSTVSAVLRTNSCTGFQCSYFLLI